ncbi:MAG: sigma-54-dependent Fis family transcriptional regulator [Deltaproteobacteria bacterium]|nr:sigma-54-dependent Fis family transcriptional regulator [Deltaproteobacteria bacterium]
MRSVLIADDEDSIVWVLKNFFEDKGFSITTTSDGTEAARIIKKEDPAIAILDINMPGKDGLQVLREAKRLKGNGTSIIIMTAETTMTNAVEAMKRGAFDYITKPVDIDELEVTVERALEDRRLRGEVSTLKDRLKEKLASETIFVGESKAVQKIFKTIGRIAPKDVSVLITGESGTGKELVAKLIHSNSTRNEGPFIAMNSAAVPTELLESELFGHEKGAFTGAHERKEGKFELADNGTLFLDEIADMDKQLQAKLLRALQEMEFYRLGGRKPVKVNVRVLAATNQDISKLIAEGTFREDLLHRLNVVEVNLPPLRERDGDIKLLAEYFFSKFMEDMSIERRGLTKKALTELEAYTWPGNVRELENILRRSSLLSPNLILSTDDLALPKKRMRKKSIEDIITAKLEPFVERTSGELYDSLMPFMERPLITLVLKKTGFNQVKAAEILGINRNTLRKKIKDLKIKRIKTKD